MIICYNNTKNSNLDIITPNITIKTPIKIKRDCNENYEFNMLVGNISYITGIQLYGFDLQSSVMLNVYVVSLSGNGIIIQHSKIN